MAILEDVKIDSPKNLVADLLGNNQGVAIGDSHGEFCVTDFLKENMESFREQGVRTLFFEMVDSRHQEELDDLNDDGDVEKNGFVLRTSWEYVGDQNPGTRQEYFSVIEAARKHGIRVVGIDCVLSGSNRFTDSNPEWVRTIEENKGDGKFIVFGGKYHFQDNPEQEKGGGVPYEGLSVSKSLDIPSVSIDTSPDGETLVRVGEGELENDYVVMLPKSPTQTLDNPDSEVKLRPMHEGFSMPS